MPMPKKIKDCKGNDFYKAEEMDTHLTSLQTETEKRVLEGKIDEIKRRKGNRPPDHIRMKLLQTQLKQDFKKWGDEIKEAQKDKQCWKCKNFHGYYYDGVTFTCKKLGDNQMWDFEGDNCEFWITN